jgi:Heavy metal associated domain 2
MSSERHLCILHSVAGRFRLGIDPLRNSPAAAEALCEAVRAVPGIRDARANAWAACLVVEHDEELPLPDVLARLARVPDLAAWGVATMSPTPVRRERPERPRGTPSQAVESILSAASHVSTAAHEALGKGSIDLKLVVPGALAGYGLLRLVTGRPGVMPHWIVFLIYGLDTFALFNQKAIRRYVDAPPAAATAQ